MPGAASTRHRGDPESSPGEGIMPRPHKLRLADGSVIELEPADMRSWYEQGLINAETPVQVPGSNTWSQLSKVMDVGGRRPARSAGAARPSAPAARASSAPVNRSSYASTPSRP